MTDVAHSIAPIRELAEWTADDVVIDSMRAWARRALRLTPADLALAVLAARAVLERTRPEWSDRERARAISTALYVETELARERAPRRRAA